ncbi:hypothetical protein [Bradyrhizobium elkanii]|uniref:hypothetical protein n=1 Tax=Bradyrhizobium elkanii TaxID=29448 RepID=UPI0004ADF0CC|nr:hypothetical protein [Bradyrhizobium elkanii]WLA82149.1 hypothetical protein QNJ99_43555 [Bradyrhizobium elkanii]
MTGLIWDVDKLRIATDAAGIAFETDFRILHEGTVRWISARGRDHDQGIVGRIMYGVFIDVTDRKGRTGARNAR